MPPIYIELTTELSNQSNLSGKEKAGKASVRRPLRGLEVKEDTYAYIKLVRRDGTAIELLDSSAYSGKSEEYSNFILQGVVDQRMEKQQLIETFGADYLMLFGEAPHFLQVSSMLVNSHDFDWKGEFLDNYEKYLRGTKAIEQGARTYLFYDGAIVEGYILNASIQETSEMPHLVPLQFQFFVTNYQVIRVTADSGMFPVRSSVVLPAGITIDDLRSPLSGELMDALLSQGDGNQSGFTRQSLKFDKPLRSRVSDNYDEYTAPLPQLPGEGDDEAARLAAQLAKDAAALDKMLSDLQQAYGVDPAGDPNTMQGLGYGPSFGRAGVGIGAHAGASVGASFGARAGAYAGASAGAYAGARAGVYAGASAGARIGASAGAYAGAGFGLGAGAYAGASAGAGFGVSVGVGAGFGLGIGARAGLGFNSGAQVGFGPPSPSSGAPYSSVPYAAYGVHSGSYAYSSVGASGLAGGYSGANASLGPLGIPGPIGPGSSYAGSSGGGGGVNVGGHASAFGFLSVGGTLGNTNVPPRNAVNGFSKSWGWHL